MIKMSIHVDIDDAVRRLNGMQWRASDYRPVFEKARERLAKANVENFTTGGLPAGGWAPRSTPAPWPIMRRTDRLFSSLASLRGNPNQINRKTATFGTDVEYAHFHQSGTQFMSRRKVVFTPAGFARDVASDAVEHIVGD